EGRAEGRFGNERQRLRVLRSGCSNVGHIVSAAWSASEVQHRGRRCRAAPIVARESVAAQTGKPSKLGTSHRSRVQPALLATKMCASGAIPTSVDRDPAGTTSIVPSMYGMAD